MGRRAPRVFGTSEANLARAELALGRKLPPSFRAWLQVHNGKGLGALSMYTIEDERNPQTLVDSLLRHQDFSWAEWLDPSASAHLVPFGFVDADLYCFDYSRVGSNGECPVVLWSHETGETEHRAVDFEEFVIKEHAGAFRMD